MTLAFKRYSALAALPADLDPADLAALDPSAAAEEPAFSLPFDSALLDSELFASVPPDSALLFSEPFDSPDSLDTGLLAGLVALLSLTYQPEPLKITPAA